MTTAMHPQRRAELSAAARETARVKCADLLGNAWRADYGWLLVTIDWDKTRYYEDIPPGTSHADASAILRERIAAAEPRCRCVELIQKTFDPVALENKGRRAASDQRAYVPANPLGYTGDLDNEGES
jgi:hypothetical protein